MKINCEIVECSAGKELAVITPHSNAWFVNDAKRIGGRWNGGQWVFDVRTRKQVERACVEHYGGETCTLQIEWTSGEGEFNDPLSVCGRTLAKASGRDSGALLGKGVVILDGLGFGSGGSVKNWKTVVTGGTIVHVYDFPIVQARELVAEQVEGTRRKYSIVVPEEAGPEDDRAVLDELLIERAQLLERLQEVEASIASIDARRGGRQQ